MSDSRWQRVEEIFHQAAELAPEARSAFLDQVCAGDEPLRREVESLLAHDAEDGSTLANAVADAAGSTVTMVEDLSGRTIGPYQVLGRIGAGGMGVVYKARDTELGRTVAIKVLPADCLSDPDRKHRFIREAKAASALNHPNIVTIYTITHEGGAECIVMEYVEGRTLAETIPKGGLPLKEALPIAIEIADAMAAAHGAGIVHRDLKPSNIMLTGSGRVKVLDFGLAKLAGNSESPQQSQSTEAGRVVGTAAYMSPEQAQGRKVDGRTDIFSFGCVLYEMVAGRRAFQAESTLSTLAAILHDEPVPLGGDTPHDLAMVVARCLRKDPARRFQHMDDVKVALEELKEESDSGKAAAAQVPTRPRNRRFPRPALAAAAVLVLAAGSVFLWRRIQATPLTDKDSIVLSDFTNTTGDSVFDDTLKQGLAVQLEQSPFLKLVSESKVNETLKLMGRPAGDRLTPEVTREVCQRTGSKAMLAGSIAGLGSQYVIGLKAVNCDTGDMLAEAQEQAAGKEAVLKALDVAAVHLRSKLGESLSSVEKYATPLEAATTRSLEALKAYSLGVKSEYAKEWTNALPFYQRAVALDPNFAMAYARMGGIHFVLNEGGRGAEYLHKAYDLREEVSERERFLIEGYYHFWGTGEMEKAAQTYELWQQTYPRDGMPYIMLGCVSADLGNWEKALEEFREALRLDRGNAVNYLNLGIAYTTLNRLDEAEAVYKQAEERKLENELLLQSRYWLAFLKGDAAQMAQLVSAAMGKPGAEDLLLATQADTEGWYGKLKNAHELTGRAMDSAQHHYANESAAEYQAAAALREVESGDREQARAEAHAAVKLAPNRDVRVMAALALARAGDMAGAEKLAAELDKTFPLDTLVERYWLPTIRAAVALERQDPNRAIELLKVASTIELSEPSQFTIFLCPVYVRGEAYLMAHDGNRAAAEFQKFIDYRGVAMNFPWGALARLGLARAYALEGDTAKARAAYRDFLTLWKDADPDIPILKEAKAEYAKLQ
jgi:serine/threonine protein kinase/tetratricopeptide (TPR) repeat protein